jgi:hypothetical protein
VVAEGPVQGPRQALRVKATRCGFGPGGHWIWKLPEEATDKAIYFHPGEWRSFIVGHRHKFPALPVGI